MARNQARRNRYRARRLSPEDWAQGVVQLWRGAFFGITNVVEGVHGSILTGFRRVNLVQRPIAVHTRAAYRTVRQVGDITFIVADQAVGLAGSLLPGTGRDFGRNGLALVSAFNGAFGNHLEATGNSLALDMTFRAAGGQELPVDRVILRQRFGRFPPKRLVVLVHGLGMNDRQWQRAGGADFGSRLQADHRYAVVYLRYNTGRHISRNGRDFAAQLEALVRHYPGRIERLVLIGHSMGGLVCRSAVHYAREAEYSWLQQLTELAYLGSPHMGAPLERLGHALNHALTFTPVTAPLANIGRVRSAGVKDLRYGFLVDADWRDRDSGHPERVTPTPVPLPSGVRAYYAAASLGRQHGDFADRWLGDLLVPVKSAIDAARKPSRRLEGGDEDGRVFFGMNHFEIMNHPQVYAALSEWLHGNGWWRRRLPFAS